MVVGECPILCLSIKVQLGETLLFVLNVMESLALCRFCCLQYELMHIVSCDR